MSAIEFNDEVNKLVADRYLHEIIPKYGSMVVRYKLGAVGGTLLRSMIKV